MIEYYTVIQLVSYLFIIIMARHTLYRVRFMMQMFQQSGYKINEFGSWLKKHWSLYGITVAHASFNLLLLILLLYMEGVFTSTTIVLIVTVFALFWFGSITPYYLREEKKPLIMTPRMMRLAVVVALLLVPGVVFGIMWSFEAGYWFPDIYILGFTWIIASLAVPLLLMAAATVTYPIEKTIQQGFINKAKRKLAAMPDLQTVAITGSYGKTSSKFILKTILQERYNVCATPGSYNTPMGICKVINNDLEARHQILILEMGARYKGNIDELCRIAQPDIAILTNIGVAHLETFGSIEAIAETKTSLFHHVKKGGWAVLNADDERVMSRKPRDKQTISAGLENGRLRAGNISYDSQGCRFDVTDHETGEAVSIQTPLLGAHNIQNIVQAMAAAKVLDIRFNTMAAALKKMEPVEHRMELKNTNGMVIIDDAFNSNPVGARSAVDTLSRFQGGRKFLITPGMIELGAREDEENRELGRFIGNKQLDQVYLVGRNQTQALQEGLRESGFDMNKAVVVNSLYDANRKLQEEYQPGDVVLYENDLPDAYNEP